jgi:predicted nucleic acid-binding protein
LDSVVLIDSANGIELALNVLAASRGASISIITWIEVLAGARDAVEEAHLRDLLRRFLVLPVTLEIAEVAASIRRERRLKLPDAVIFATARVHRLVLVTRNTKDFPPGDTAVRIPYTL